MMMVQVQYEFGSNPEFEVIRNKYMQSYMRVGSCWLPSLLEANYTRAYANANETPSSCV